MNNSTIEGLFLQWARTKELISKANEQKKSLENQILALQEVNESFSDKPIGLRSITEFEFNGEKVRAQLDKKEIRKWDQNGLKIAASSIPAEQFPFRLEFKEDRKKANEIAQHYPEVWAIIKPLLTTSEGSATLSIKAKK